MKHWLIILSALAVTLSCGSGKKAVTDESVVENVPLVTPEDGLYSPDTLIILCDGDEAKAKVREVILAYGAEIKYDYSIICGFAIKIPEGKTIAESMEYFKNVPGIISVERDQIIHLTDPVEPVLEII